MENGDKKTEQSQEKSVEELQREVKEFKKQVLFSAVLIIAVLAVIAIACAAWFASNSRVSASSMQVSPYMDSFALASTGDAGNHDNILELLSDWASPWGIGDSTRINDAAGTTTSNSKTSINWLMSTTDNIANDAGNTGGIQPGTSGQLTFYVIPGKDGTLTTHFNLSMYPYQLVTAQTEPEEAVATIEAPRGTQEGTYLVPSAETEAALLSGHLLFFENRDANGYYSELLTGDFTKTFTDAEAGKPYEVTIYWVWPYVFGQMLLRSQELGGRAPIFADGDAQKTLLQNDILAYPEKYFNGIAGEDYSELVTAAALNSIISGSYNSVTFSRINSYYNHGDQTIGDRIDYVLLRLTAMQ